MKILLDTHTLVLMALEPERLSNHAQDRIEAIQTREILVSSFSLWEVCKLVQKRKLFLNKPVQEWFAEISRQPKITIVDVSAEIALESCHLPGIFHSDPADQIIVATARIHGATLLTKDEKILDYPHVKSEW
jgi:PIN domain nuclease of toxin-antitoxin system